jgi:hypothetical protein
VGAWQTWVGVWLSSFLGLGGGGGGGGRGWIGILQFFWYLEGRSALYLVGLWFVDCHSQGWGRILRFVYCMLYFVFCG